MKFNNNEEDSSSAEATPKRAKIDEHPPVNTITQCPPLLNPFEQELFDAVNSGNLPQTLSAIEYADDRLLSIDGVLCPQNLTALQIAASKGYTDICRVLIQKGADVNLKCQGLYPLNLASCGNHIDTCSILIEFGAKLNVASDLGSSSDGRTPLQDAACFGCVELIRVLIKSGANINTKAGYNLTTALHFAVDRISIDTVEELLKHNPDINAQNKHGCTPLDLAEHLPQIFSALVRHGAKFDPRYRQLREAAKQGDSNACLEILRQGCNVNTAGGWRHDTPLMLAASRDHAKTCKILLENRARLDVANKDGETPLRVVINLGYMQTVHVLMNEFFSNMRAYDSIYREYVEAAVEIGDMSICEQIIVQGPLVASKDRNGLTLLHIAAYFQQVEVCQLLIDRGSDVNARDSEGETPLYKALISPDTLDNTDTAKVAKIFYLMIHQGADVSIPNINCEYDYYNPLSLVLRTMDREACNSAIPRAIFITTYYSSYNTHGFLGALSNDNYATLCAKTRHTVWLLNKQFKLPLSLCHIILDSISDLRMDLLMILMRRIINDWQEGGYLIQKKSMQSVPVQFHPLICHGIFSNTIRELKCMYKKFGLKNSKILEQQHGESIMSNIKEKLGVTQAPDVSPDSPGWLAN